MFTKDLISIIVPVYNVEQYLEQCIDSICGQTYPTLEIILVDDGSTDSSGAICDAYAERDSRIKVIHKRNGGLSSARNAGLEMATGEFVAYVDSDDWVELGIYEACIKAMRQNEDADLALFPYVYFDQGKQDSGHLLPQKHKLSREEALSEYECATFQKGINPSVWSKLFRHEAIQGIKFPTGRVYEDLPYTYEVLSRCRSVVVINQVGYNYRRDNAGSISNTIKANILDVCHNLEELRDRYEAQGRLDLVVGVNSLLTTHMRMNYFAVLGKPFAIEYMACVSKLKKYSFRAKSRSVYLVYRTFQFAPRFSFELERFIHRLYSFAVRFRFK